jgi:tRNA pseudouridine55 synthase
MVYNVKVILNINKQKGWTSFDVVAKIRNIFNIKKVGHAGTLDPLAEGVLIVLTDKDTKQQDRLMHTDKEYRAEIMFGFESPTYDMEGPLSYTGYKPDLNEVRSKVTELTGTITQTVPPYSAVKQGGVRLYKKARAGRIDTSSLPKRQVTIYAIDIESFDEEEFVFDGRSFYVPVLMCSITCSSGTYIRSIAHDLGGVLKSLVRTRVGDFLIEDSVTIDELIG